MIWDWDLWAVMIEHDARTAVFDNLSAHLATLQYHAAETMAELGRRLGVPFEAVVEALNKVGAAL